MMIKFKYIATIVNLLASTASIYAYSMPTAYEDAADSSPEWFWFVTLAVALAYPVLLLIIFIKFRGQQTLAIWSFFSFCARVAAKQLLPLFCMTYLVGTFVLLGVAIVFTVASYVLPVLQSLETLVSVLWWTFAIWYLFCLVVFIKWLPKSLEEC